MSTRTRILDAALEGISQAGLQGVALGDVAAGAGVSRQTLYRHFGSRDGLLTATILREEKRMIDQVLSAAASHDELPSAVHAALLVALRAVREHPLLVRLLALEPDQIIPLIARGRGPVMVAARESVQHVFDRFLDPAQAAVAADVASRLVMSYAVDPGNEPPELLADRLTRMLLVLVRPR